MPSLIVYRLIREINEYYNQIQSKSSFKYMNKDNVRDTNFIISSDDFLLLDQVDLAIVNEAVTKRKNRFIAIHTLLNEPIIIPTVNENNISCIRNRNYIMPSYY
jgi:hypothetical protein